MHIRKKLLSGLILLFALVAASILLTIHHMVLPGIAEAERAELAREIEQARYAIEGELARLKSFAVDWGEWDDTYRYIQSPNLEYETSNLVDSTLPDVQASMIVYLDGYGRMVQKLEHEVVRGLLESPGEGDSRHLIEALIQLAKGNGSGILTTDRGALLMASNPIRRSSGRGPDLGYIVFGRLLDEQLQQSFANRLLLPLEFSVVPHQAMASQVVFKDSNTSLISGYMPFENDLGSSLQLNILHHRPFYSSTIKLVSFSIILLLVIGCIITGGAYFMIRRTLVDPILMLKAQTELFKHSKSSIGIAEIDQNDELGALSHSFVDMLRELEASNNVLEQERQKFLDESLTDPLTRLGNRRFLQQYLNAQARAGRSEWLFVMIDLDHFKKVNDRYGHDVGDDVLVEVAGLLRDIARRNDVVTRFGGEEFVILCHGVGKETATSIVERIRQHIEQHEFYLGIDEHIHVTCSIGFFVLEVDGAGVSKDWSSMLKVSDLAMYAAKNSGRNTWVGVTPADKGCSGGYPITADQIEACINNNHLLVLSFQHQTFSWERREVP